MSEDRTGASSFEDLEVFKRAYRISLDVHRASLDFPAVEQRALTDQIRRESKSICANLAEGFARQGHAPADFRRFVTMATGSSDEMRVWSRYCLDLGYIDETMWKQRRVSGAIEDASGFAYEIRTPAAVRRCILIPDFCHLIPGPVAERSVGP